MFVGRNFDPANTVESQVYGFDFINDLADGDSLSSVTCNLTVQQGVDATPSARLIGLPSVYSSTIGIQRISGLVEGTVYTFQMIALTSFGNTLSLYSHIPSQAVY